MSETAIFDVAAGTRRVVRRWWLLVITALVGAALGSVYHAHTDPKYTATASFALSTADATAILGTSFSIGDPSRFAATQAAIIESSAVKDRVEHVVGRSVPDADASEEPNVDIIDVSVTDTSPALAARVANEYGSAYLAIETEQTQSQLQPLQRRLSTQANVLSARLAALRHTDPNGTTAATAATTAQLSQVDSQLIQVQGALHLGAIGVSRLAAATVPTSPSSPTRTTEVIEGALLGLLFGVVVALAVPARRKKASRSAADDDDASDATAAAATFDGGLRSAGTGARPPGS